MLKASEAVAIYFENIDLEELSLKDDILKTVYATIEYKAKLGFFGFSLDYYLGDSSEVETNNAIKDVITVLEELEYTIRIIKKDNKIEILLDFEFYI